MKASKQFQADHPAEAKKLRELYEQYEATHSADTQKALEAMEAEIGKVVPRPPLSVLIDHIDHIAKVAGVDHVGLGSDFDGVSCLPEGIESVADLPKITKALAERGYKEQDLKKFLGGNLLRVFGEVEKVAHQLQTAKNTDTREVVKLPAKKE
jgi:membrane dipeptidase